MPRQPSAEPLILGGIRRLWEECQAPPTEREIAAEINRSEARVHALLLRLESEGKVVRLGPRKLIYLPDHPAVAGIADPERALESIWRSLPLQRRGRILARLAKDVGAVITMDAGAKGGAAGAEETLRRMGRTM